MKRGFPAQAERQACALRRELNLRNTDPLPARLLARHLNVQVIDPRTIPGMTSETLSHLCIDGDWSALAIVQCVPHILIYNPNHSPARVESDLMHELSHIIEEHSPAAIAPLFNLPVLLRTYDREQEEEAEYLGGCLQITREGLLWAVRRNMSNESIAEYYGASVAMVRFRRNRTGVDQQVGRAKSYFRC